MKPMTKNETLAAFAAAIKLAEENGLSETLLVKGVFPECDTFSEADFAVAVIEDKPVFIGDTLYSLRQDCYGIVSGAATFYGHLHLEFLPLTKSSKFPIRIDNLCWKAPKTFTVGKVRLIAPTAIATASKHWLDLQFTNSSDRDAALAAFQDYLNKKEA